MASKRCIFCNLDNLKIIFQNANYALIEDIRPATKHHYLVIPKEHTPNPKYLNNGHVPLIQEMKSVALDYMEANIQDFDKDILRLGFHWAPFNTISHIHLHVLYPTNQLSFIGGLIFRPKSFWFSDVDDTIEHLKSIS